MRIFAKPHKFLAVSAVLLFVSATPTLAQQYAGSRNPLIGTVGDLDTSKLRSRVTSAFNLRFGPAGLFAGADVFDIPSYKPFIYPLPNFSSSEDYTGVSFDDYLEQVARSYGHSIERYLGEFAFQNEYSMTNGVPLYEGYQDLGQVSNYLNIGGLNLVNTAFPDFASNSVSELLTKLNDIALRRIHERDFAAGGGFLPFDKPTIPNDPQDDKPFIPLPVPGTPPAPDTSTDNNDIANLANEIVGGGALTLNNTGSLNLEGNNIVGENLTVANVAVVPEPATLGLLALGTGLMLGRRRR